MLIINSKITDTIGQKIALFTYIVDNYQNLAITWTKMAEALEYIGHGDLSQSCRDVSL